MTKTPNGRTVWAYVPLSALDIPKDTLGGHKPPRPIVHG